MKFNPNCNVETLGIWLNNINPPAGVDDTPTHFDTSDLLNGNIQIDGWVSARHIKMIHEWFEAHKKCKGE